ncbi:hypothetical protein PDESU_04280 [Pontiella desulfatans]|nr:hypothetical protein [Pontiella desulfatans]VGO15695.1 hypothetical protein PDESU_04280 [Pontiella desulfatans]
MSRENQVSFQDLFITADKILGRIGEIQETDEFMELKSRYQESCHRGFDFSDVIRDGMLLGLTVSKRWGSRFDDYEMHHASVLARAWSNISSIGNFHTYTFEVVSQIILDYMSMDTSSMCQEIMAQSKEEVCRTGGSHLDFLYDAVIASFINDPQDLTLEKLEEGRYFERAAEQARTRFTEMYPELTCEQAA